ncbi:hypothetical protein [Streptomyces sp. NPDC001851]|uniref:hypothetical protein n=1 Tax=Streptomyces sp. NPDC001851 TaxID=3154529 RepID=UPI0033315328
MRVRVDFRFNAETGEVELFQVDDIGRATRTEDHDATHEDIAHAIGRVLDRSPVPEEVRDQEREPQPLHLPAQTDPADGEQHREPRRARE